MAFFKFRKGGDEHHTPTPAPESVEAMRTRAKHRLIGAAVLVLIGVVGFPQLFDSQPRPVALDIPIEIPDKNKAKPLPTNPVAASAVKTSGVVDEHQSTAPAATSTSAAATTATPTATATALANAPVTTASATAAPASVAAGAAGAAGAAAAASKSTTTSSAPEPAKPVAKPVEKAVVKPAAKPAAHAGRFVVQVGAFTDVGKAREARAKLEKLHLKTYTQVVQTKEGRRIRVRVGPFESKAEADKAVDKIKKLDLPASVLEL